MIPVKGYAAKSAQSPLALFHFERRDPDPHDVQFDILYCGVCHSDIHQARDEWHGSIFPMVPGHEIVGRVTKTGKKVKRFSPGDLAAVGCMVDSCRTCENCKEGLEQYCLNGNVLTYNSYERMSRIPTYGGYSKLIVVDEDFVLRISDRFSLEAVAPLLCAGITTYSPLRHWKVGKGDKIGILGLGGLGHMAVKIAASFGAEVTILSRSQKKEADAKRLGAHNFILTTNSDRIKTMKGYFNFILDTVSAEHDYNMYLRLLKTNGVQICIGAPPNPSEIAAFNLIEGRKSLAGSLIGGIRETQEMLDHCADHNIVSDVEVINISYINKAFERMLKGDVRYRFVIDMATLK